MLFVEHRLYVAPDVRLPLQRSAHESKIGGHGGRTSTYDLLYRNYTWPNMSHDVAEFVIYCCICMRIKKSRQRKPGLLQPLPPANRPFRELTMDLVIDLPPSTYQGLIFTNIMSIVCRLTKRRKFIPVVKITSRDVAETYEQEG